MESVRAAFVPVGSPVTTIQVAGSGRGFVTVQAGNTVLTCASTCAVPISSPTITLTARPVDPFAGWTNGCGTNQQACTVPTPSSVTATFDANPHELGALLLAVPTAAVTWAPDGNLLAAGPRMLSELRANGDVMWSSPLPEVPSMATLTLAVGATGEIYVSRASYDSGNYLTKLSAGGQVQWTQALTDYRPCGEQGESWSDPYPHQLAVSPNGDVGVVYMTYAAPPVPPAATFAVLDANGALRWSAPLGQLCSSVEVNAAGVWHVMASDGTTTGNVVQRYDANGTMLAPLGTLPAYTHLLQPALFMAALALEPNGDVAASITSEGNSGGDDVTVSHVLANGTAAFSARSNIAFSSNGYPWPSGVAVDSAGNVFAPRSTTEDWGIHVDVFDPTGATLWSMDDPDAWARFTAVAADRAGHVALAGRSGATPWIEMFASP
jgi:hypothetical protein